MLFRGQIGSELWEGQHFLAHFNLLWSVNWHTVTFGKLIMNLNPHITFHEVGCDPNGKKILIYWLIFATQFHKAHCTVHQKFQVISPYLLSDLSSYSPASVNHSTGLRVALVLVLYKFCLLEALGSCSIWSVTLRSLVNVSPSQLHQEIPNCAYTIKVHWTQRINVWKAKSIGGVGICFVGMYVWQVWVQRTLSPHPTSLYLCPTCVSVTPPRIN